MKIADKIKLIIASIIGITLPVTAYAKKIEDYVPPPFISRLFISIITIAPGCILIAIAAYFINKKLDKENSIKKKNIFFILSASFIIIGSLWAATDVLNDELFSPASEGSIIGSLIPSLAIILLNRRNKLLYRLVIAILLVIPSFWVSTFIICGWQELGYDFGIPTTW